MSLTISIDAMGGDHGPDVVIPAAVSALASHPTIKLILVGDQDVIKDTLKHHKADSDPRFIIHHASQRVEMDDAPASALRNKKDSSMRVSINLVKEGVVDACVSAGNTGALMATARFVLRMLPGIDRPAISSELPSANGTTCMLDLGANADCTPEQLLQFGIMGSILTNVLHKKNNPSIGLLSNGSEAMKGSEVVKKSAELFRNSHLNFHGNVEGDDIFKGTTDVVVCDGFTGNIVLKTMEGTARLQQKMIKKSFIDNLFKPLLLPVNKALKPVKDRLDPDKTNGAYLLGVNGVVTIAHGSSSAEAVMNSIIFSNKQ